MGRRSGSGTRVRVAWEQRRREKKGEGGRKEKGNEKEKGEKEREIESTLAGFAVGNRAWTTGSRAARDGTAARKRERERGLVGGKREKKR